MVILVAVVAFLALPTQVMAAGAATDAPADEAAFVRRINELRASKGLGQLTIHPELVQVARQWATSMAAVDRISHNPRLADAVKADWQKLGENVGVGMTVDGLHDAFVASPLHYKNLVDPDFTYVGVGVVYGRDGAIFTTHQFMKLRPRAEAPPASAPVSAPKASPVAARVPSTAPPQAAPLPAATIPARLILVMQQLRALDAR